ncbi:hypothetical protein PUS82_00365 [Cytobacillus firmus]|uniref:hypothetical protein n=1 Tax=Cytobacillus firmus TaxID=1399 RepID=UPI00237AB88E|nr:hypothetical protein [Cytobacillus firmus]MDD9309784.1 hypothetical protein [Cytobacillus firmus]
MKPSLKIALGIFTALATIAFIFFYDFYLKDRIDSVEVVIVKPGEEIMRSERISEEKLMIERRQKKALIQDVVYAKDMKKIVGRDSTQNLVGNSMISHKMVDYDLMIPDPAFGEAVRPITNEMIYAQPGSLRRKDVIDIYLVNSDGTKIPFQAQQQADAVETEASAESSDSNKDNSKANINKMDTKPFLKGIKVVYVKDSGNKEVVSSSESKGKEDKRLNATSNISDIEVIMNEEDFTKLMDEVLTKGSKLYITYQ